MANPPGETPTTSFDPLTGADELAPGTTFERYRVLDFVGEGSWARVYRAFDTRLERPVALKVMKSRVTEAHPRFLAEVQSVSALHHPNIVTVFETGATASKVLYLTLEWVEGGSLERLLAERGTLPWQETVRIALALAEALDHAHRRGLLHRDLKPANVLIGADGQPKLTDFGVAGALSAVTGQTQAGFVVGTPRYMAPEQLTGRSHSPATDVFGLGLLLFEMLFGSLPDTESVHDLITLRMTRDIEIPRRSDLPYGLVTLLQRMLRREQADRPATAAEVAAALGSLLPANVTDQRRRPEAAAVAAPTAPYAPAPGPPTLSVPAQPRASHSQKSAVGARLPVAGLVLLAIFGLVALLVLFERLGSEAAIAEPGGTTPGLDPGLLVGPLLVATGMLAGWAVARWLVQRRAALDQGASELLAGTRDRSALTRTIAIRVDELIARTHAIDAQVLGATIVQMVHEYDRAKDSSDRQAALMNTAQLLEQLMERLSPWYVRHDKAIAFVVTAVGVVAGIVKILSDIVRLTTGG